MTLVLRSDTTGIRPAFEHIVETRRVHESFATDVQRRDRARNEREVRRFQIKLQETTEAHVEYLREMYDQSYGGVSTVEYTPVDETDSTKIDATFVPGSLEIVRTGPVTYSAEFEIEEVF